MRKSRYVVAISVDAYIAGPKEKPTGLAPTRKSMFWRSRRTLDTLLMGRKTLLGSYQETGREDVCRSCQHRVLAHDEGTGHPGVTIISTQPVTAR